MSDNIVKLSEYQNKPSDRRHCWVTLVGKPFFHRTQEIMPTLTVEIPDGDYEPFISRIRDDGGFYSTTASGLETFFSPWPCAGVVVRHQYSRHAEKDIPRL